MTTNAIAGLLGLVLAGFCIWAMGRAEHKRNLRRLRERLQWDWF